jgi:putative SOS response-associated peptidase YedK
MCNLYSITKGQAAIIEFTRAMRDTTGNLPPLPGIFPDYEAPVVANRDGLRELCLMRWGMPSSQKALLDAASKRADKLRAAKIRKFRRPRIFLAGTGSIEFGTAIDGQ